jgi:hypothetical protein
LYVSGTATAVITNNTTAIAAKTRNGACQLAMLTTTAAVTSPRNPPASALAAQYIEPRPRPPFPSAAAIVASVPGNTSAAPMPDMTRPTRTSAIESAKPSSTSEASTIVSPITIPRLRPWRSSSPPAGSSSAASSNG